MHSAEKARDTALNDKKQLQRNKSVVITLARWRHVPANKCPLALRTSVTLVRLLVHYTVGTLLCLVTLTVCYR